MSQDYLDTVQAEALVKLRENGGNVKRTASELGIPRTTLITWRDKVSAVSDTIPQETKDKYIGLWERAEEACVQRILDLVPTAEDLRDVAYAANIAKEAVLDRTEGRKGATTNIAIDNRKVEIVYEDKRS